MALTQVLRRVLGSTPISSAARAFSSAPSPIPATLFPGDGIGPEIAEAVKQVFQAAEVPIEWEEHYVGDRIDPRTQSFLTWESLESVRRNKVGLKGPMATPIGKGHRSLNLTLRKELNLYANVRPCYSLPGYKTRYDDVDLITIRENTEGEYSGLEHQVVRGVVESIKIITRQASLRVAEYAFHYAKTQVTGHRVTEMLCSSGTSAGEPKLMPTIAEDLDRRTFVYNLIMPIMNQYIPGLDEGKAMFLYFIKAEMSTPCGLPARTVLTSYYKSKHFKCRTRDAFNDFTSPDQAILCKDSNQSMYCQLLSGLVQRHQVLRLGAVFASAFLRAISFLERNWGRLCNDIRSGELDPTITDPECRSCMSMVLTSPNPCLADEIEDICSNTSWKGILCHLWPRAKYIEAVVTGSMAQYIPALEYYSEGKLPLVCTMYASSECYFGVNLKPLCDPADVAFTLLPNMCYFEFIHLGDNGTWLVNVDEEGEVPNDKLVNLVNVRLGSYYELVVTTFAGLNRYRIGDVLRVTGFHNKAPQFQFICRINVVLSIDNDKTNEEDLQKSITTAKKLLEPYGALLVEYTSYADTSSVPGHYVLYWEILHDSSFLDSSAELDFKVLQECCISVEEELDYVYRRCRAHDKSVGPLEIRVVESGTFEAVMDFFIGQGASINQYKTPRCIKSNAALKLLNSHVKASAFSPRDPAWIP